MADACVWKNGTLNIYARTLRNINNFEEFKYFRVDLTTYRRLIAIRVYFAARKNDINWQNIRLTDGDLRTYVPSMIPRDEPWNLVVDGFNKSRKCLSFVNERARTRPRIVINETSIREKLFLEAHEKHKAGKLTHEDYLVELDAIADLISTS